MTHYLLKLPGDPSILFDDFYTIKQSLDISGKRKGLKHRIEPKHNEFWEIWISPDGTRPDLEWDEPEMLAGTIKTIHTQKTPVYLENL